MRSTDTDVLVILVRSTDTDVLVILVRSTDTDVLVILVRSTDTDVLVILIGLAGRSERITIILDYIHTSNPAANLDEKQYRLTEALMWLHSLAVCDFTSCFFGKGKVKPFTFEADVSHEHVMAVRSLTSEEVDVPAVTSCVCLQYGFNTCDINEARYKAFMRMTGDNEKEPLISTGEASPTDYGWKET